MSKFASMDAPQPYKRSTNRIIHAILATALVFAMLLPAASVAQAQGGVHTVARGETLANIAVAYGINSTELARVNSVSNPNLLYVGQQLTLPGSSAAPVQTISQPAAAQPAAQQPAVAVSTQSASTGYVTVGRGDTLSQIAKDYGMGLGDILRLNGLNNANYIWVGQQLRVTGTTATTTAATTTATTTAATTTAATTTAATTTAATTTAATTTAATTTAATTTAATTTAAAVETTSSVADSIYVVKYGDTLANIAAAYGVSGSTLMSSNGLPNANFIWTGQRLRIPGGSASGTIATTTAAAPVAAPVVSSPAAYGRKLIEIDLSKQKLIAWQGDQQVLNTHISSGTYKTPTVTGRFLVSWKLANQHMYGDDFDLPNVPWVMYFYEGYAIHGAYWHNNFGMPMSHGCVNMVPSQAGFLYEWAPVGTEIYVHY